ncbi:MAG TPA: hypothetical protein VF777_01305 [Phycisphaerales bacterium]
MSVGPTPISPPGLIRALAAALRQSLRWPDWVWLAACTPCLWFIGAVLGLDDAERLGIGYDPLAPRVAAWGLAIGIASVWMWRRWLIRNHPLRPAHDTPTDVLIVAGSLGALAIYLAIVPGHKLLPPNTTLCLLSGVAGAALLRSAWTRRVGESFHCSHCGYEIEDFSLPRRCPECEGVWAHRLVRGRVERSTPLIALSVALLFLLTLAPLPRLDSSSPFIRRMTPTAWILARATERLQATRTLESAWWRELTLRRLDETDAERLRELVLREQLANRLMDANAYAWLQGELFTGRGSDSQFRRFLDDALTPSIAVRGRSGLSSTTHQTGETLTVAPLIEDSRRLPRDRIAVYVEGIWKNDEATPLVRSSKWETLSNLLTFDPRLPLDTDSVRAGTSFPLRKAERFTLTGKYWIAIVPDGTPPIALPKDMNPLPTGVAWMGEFEARRQVNVTSNPNASAPPRPKP